MPRCKVCGQKIGFLRRSNSDIAGSVASQVDELRNLSMEVSMRLAATRASSAVSDEHLRAIERFHGKLCDLADEGEALGERAHAAVHDASVMAPYSAISTWLSTSQAEMLRAYELLRE